MKLKPYSRRVFYYETDNMGIVHHSNYLRWFEEARVDVIEQAGLPFQTVEERGIMSPVLAANCEFHTPFKFGDVFTVKAYIPDFSKLRFQVVYEVYNGEGVLCVKGMTEHCFVDKDMKPVRLKKHFPDIYDIYSELCAEGTGLYD